MGRLSTRVSPLATLEHNGRRLIYVHGANGCGKSTLARYLLICSGGVVQTRVCPSGGASLTETTSGPVFVGRYRTATGGADGVQPYASVVMALQWLLRSSAKHIFVEGLMTPGVATCGVIYQTAHNFGVRCDFILLDIPTEVCTCNVLTRRARKGNEKPYDNAHLLKKHKSAGNWANNLRAAGMPCHNLTWRKARDYCCRSYGVGPSGTIGLLD